MTDPGLWTELLAYGAGVALSPIHIVLLLLLLLGSSPLKRGGFFLLGWLLTSGLVVIGLLTIGHGLLLDMSHGSQHRTGLDLIAGGALVALGGRELIRAVLHDDGPPGWAKSVDRFAAMPLPLLLLPLLRGYNVLPRLPRLPPLLHILEAAVEGFRKRTDRLAGRLGLDVHLVKSEDFSSSRLLTELRSQLKWRFFVYAPQQREKPK